LPLSAGLPGSSQLALAASQILGWILRRRALSIAAFRPVRSRSMPGYRMASLLSVPCLPLGQQNTWCPVRYLLASQLVPFA
jgi:hypothetical protein